MCPFGRFNQCHYRNLVKFYDLMGSIHSGRTTPQPTVTLPKAPFSPTVTSILVAAQSRGQPAGDTCPSIRPALRQMPSVLVTARRDAKRGLTEGQTISTIWSQGAIRRNSASRCYCLPRRHRYLLLSRHPTIPGRHHHRFHGQWPAL